jgi:hypothetical protein
MTIKFEPGTEYEGANKAENIQVISRDVNILKVRTWEGYICEVTPAVMTGIDRVNTEYFTHKMRNYFAHHRAD